MLEAKNIRFSWQQAIPFRGIKNISFSLKSGEILGVLGKSGSGKSTLALCLAGMLPLENGEIYFKGQRLLGPDEQLIAGHPDIVLLRQDIQLLENHTVLENVREPLVGIDEEYKSLRTRKLLKITGLYSFSNEKARNLSEGQRQRLSLARAMIREPELLILDEPFNHLDYAWKIRLIQWIRSEQKKSGFSILWITHDAQEVLKYCQRVMCLHYGRKIAEGISQELYQFPSSRLTAELFGPYSAVEYKKKKIFVRPDRISFSLKKGSDSIPVILREQYFNGICFETLFETNTGNLIQGYSMKKYSPPVSGYIRIK